MLNLGMKISMEMFKHESNVIASNPWEMWVLEKFSFSELRQNKNMLIELSNLKSQFIRF